VKHYFHIKEELTLDEMTAGADPQVVHLEVANKGEAKVLLAQYEPSFIARSKPYVKEFHTNRHLEKLSCIKEDL
jgi:hypothetical protein